MRSSLFSVLTGVLLFSFTTAHAHDMHAHHDMAHTSATQTQVYESQGTLKKISTGSLTIAHAAIAALNWPPMTMQFAVAPGEALPALKVGDKVNFTFTQSEKGYTLVSVTPQQ